MPEEEQRYWHNQKSKMPTREEIKEAAKKKTAGKTDDQALRKENEDLKAELAQMKMKVGLANV